ncbi:unnamed protein product [Pieris brassicae]|uniref:Uncharacterized protein n=1 Tax=Pieris brassicae TaxID=7116 RepID=A0A9P0T4N8_PIEBR|nr:unnamed protein product [Pieris brassicae]
MSSDSSTSSIRQFGLYRTIDARTEEFLRLSRKRQLRQGCICAAISTAITVIVVIIIILIYEYSNVTNAHNIKPNWLGLMNQSDPLQLDPSHKTKFKLDRTTIQILPLLLKAFTKNKYFDPDVEDNSSPSPNPTEEDSTEKMHKNIFADTRNWMKMPTSRVYAIEFKTSPIVYFKNPTRNLDYFRKIRKIRDYERVMNYVDKMINDKITSGSTQPMSTRVENRIKPEKLPKYDDNINLNKNTFERNQSYNGIDHSSDKYNLFENISDSSTVSSFVIDDYYDDFTQTDPNDISSIFDILDTHTLELIKNNIISTKSHSYVKKTTPNNQNTFTIKPPHYDLKDYKRNVSDERYVIAMNSLEGNRDMSQNDALVVLNFNKTTTVKNTEFYSIEEPITNVETKYIPTIKPDNKRNELHEDTNRDEVLEQENDKLEEEMEKSTNEESTEEDFKQMENIINNFKSDNSHSSKRQKTEPTNSSELYYWEFIKIQEHAKNISKAILSKTRPTYLEMQRNNWKQEETNNIIEYDANINNYIFE